MCYQYQALGFYTHNHVSPHNRSMGRSVSLHLGIQSIMQYCPTYVCGGFVKPSSGICLSSPGLIWHASHFPQAPDVPRGKQQICLTSLCVLGGFSNQDHPKLLCNICESSPRRCVCVVPNHSKASTIGQNFKTFLANMLHLLHPHDLPSN